MIGRIVDPVTGEPTGGVRFHSGPDPVPGISAIVLASVLFFLWTPVSSESAARKEGVPSPAYRSDASVPPSGDASGP